MGLLLPVKDNNLSERISRQSTGLPDGRLYRAVAMLERAGRLRVTRTAHALLALPVEDDRWPEIAASPKHLQRADRWWYHVVRLLGDKE